MLLYCKFLCWEGTKKDLHLILAQAAGGLSLTPA